MNTRIIIDSLIKNIDSRHEIVYNAGQK